jgi:hypothetical protein
MVEKPDEKMPEAKMDPAQLYREEIITDRRVGTIRILTPIKIDETTDTSRKISYIGQAQILTAAGALPISFEIEAGSLKEAIEKFGPAAKKAVENTVKELQEMRRQAASSIVIPEGGAGGLPSSGQIKMP